LILNKIKDKKLRINLKLKKDSSHFIKFIMQEVDKMIKLENNTLYMEYKLNLPI